MSVVYPTHSNIERLVGTAVCTGCERELSITCFRTDSSKPRGRSTRCKECSRDAAQERMKRNERYRQEAISQGHTKACRSCEIDQPISNFNPSATNTGGSSYECLVCFKERHARWRKTNEDHVRQKSREQMRRMRKAMPKEKRSKYLRRWRLKRKYGLTEAAYDVIMAAQNASCAICLVKFEPVKRGWRAPVVDHDHRTGAVRAILCLGCNTGLGYFNENAETMRKAAEYIDCHKVRK
jgi:hypothetical protein